VARYVQRLRQAQGLPPREQRRGQTLPLVMDGRHQPLTMPRATRAVLKQPMKQTDEDTQLMAHPQAQHRDLAVAIDLAQDFCTIVRERQADHCDAWLARAMASGVARLRRFATGLHADYEAVKAGLMLPWSNSSVEGPINRLNILKRSMCGCAKMDLLINRGFLLAA
jgi:transposase